MDKELSLIKKLVDQSNKIIIVQADNPDADSLGSAIALEQILMSLNKEVLLYCAVGMPEYLHYLTGWSRVSNIIPIDFDISIFVDVSTLTLLDGIIKNKMIDLFNSKPSIIIDHHKEVKNLINFTTQVILNDPEASSTGEIIHIISDLLKWQKNLESKTAVMASILGDTQGLSNQLTKPKTYRIIADLIDQGVDRFKLDTDRKEFSMMPLTIYRYKAELILRTEFFYDDSIALIVLNQNDIKNYSPLYNPGPLMHQELLQIKTVKVAIIIKNYQDRHITASIRCHTGYPIAAELASKFDGGGHQYASGINVKNSDINGFKNDLLNQAGQLLTNLKK